MSSPSFSSKLLPSPQTSSFTFKVPPPPQRTSTSLFEVRFFFVCLLLVAGFVFAPSGLKMGAAFGAIAFGIGTRVKWVRRREELTEKEREGEEIRGNEYSRRGYGVEETE